MQKAKEVVRVRLAQVPGMLQILNFGASYQFNYTATRSDAVGVLGIIRIQNQFAFR